MSPSQAVYFTSSLIGVSWTDLTFRTFKQWACEGKILVAHSKAIQKSLYLSDTASNTFDATLLLHFTQLFKKIIWKERCEHHVKWESDHKISRKAKCTQAQDVVTDEAETESMEQSLDNIIGRQRHNKNLLNLQFNSRDAPDTSRIQVLDDTEDPIQPLVQNLSNGIQDKIN